MIEKEKIIKLQKKLEQRKLTIYEALQQDIAIDWLKTNNPAFLSMLTSEAVSQIIYHLITPGPPNDKIRSYKIPLIAAELLSIMTPKIYELLFTEDYQQKGMPILNRLFKYFDGPPNYVISGYVVRIIMNLFPANPSRVLEFIFKSHPERLLNFVESHSIAELLTRIIIVEDALLNVQIKQRVTLLTDIVNLYIQNKRSEDQLINLNWVLTEAITRLWSQKHKELGRFSGILFRLVQAVIDNNNLFNQEILITAISKQVAVYQKEAPFLIAAIYKKIYQELVLVRAEKVPANTKPKLTGKRFKYLQALYFIIAFGSQALSKQLLTSNVFSILLDFISRFQWHSLALVQIQKILRAALVSCNQGVLVALSRSYLFQKLKELAKLHFSQGKKGCGFSGLLINFVNALKQSLQTETGYGGWLKKNNGGGDLKLWIEEFLGKLSNRQQEMRVVHEIAKPFYSISKLPDKFKAFFEETQAINARMQNESPSKHQVQEKEVLEQIENQNQLVYKLMSQLVADTVPQDKKPQESIQ